MKAASVVSAYMLQTARPLFWHIGVVNDGVLCRASTFILQFADRHPMAVMFPCSSISPSSVMTRVIGRHTMATETRSAVGQA